MKPTELLKAAAIALLTAGIAVGCQQTSTNIGPVIAQDDCEGATPEVRKRS